MDRAEIVVFLRGLGCSKIDQQQRKQWVTASCPLAAYKHPKRVDVHPSFAVSIRPNGPSWCRCLSCGYSNSPEQLIEELVVRRGAYVTEKAQVLARTANLIDFNQELRKTRQRVSAAPATPDFATATLADLAPIPMRELAGIQVPRGVYYGNFDELREPIDPAAAAHLQEDIPPEVMAYLQGPERNLTKAAIAEWEIGYHAPSGRVTIPVYDFKKRLINVTGRALFGEKTPKWRHGDGFRSEAYLFGENKVIPGRRGYVFEGNFDPIYFSQLGYGNAVALMGTSLSPLKLEKIRQWFPEVYVALDPDKAGEEGQAKFVRALAGIVPLKEIKMPADVDLIGAQSCWHLFGSPYS